MNFGSTQNAGTGILKIDGGASFDNVSGAPLTQSGFPSVTVQAGVGETITFLGSSDLDFGGATIAANNGQAPDAYSGAQQLWNSGQQEMNDALNQGQQRLQEITDNYVNGDNKGAAVFS